MQLLCYIKYITNVISLPNWEGQADSGYHQISLWRQCMFVVDTRKYNQNVIFLYSALSLNIWEQFWERQQYFRQNCQLNSRKLLLSIEYFTLSSTQHNQQFFMQNAEKIQTSKLDQVNCVRLVENIHSWKIFTPENCHT